MEQVQVTIEIPLEGKPAYKHSYTKSVAQNVADVQAIARAAVTGKPEDEQKQAASDYLVKAFNYGNDLLVRAAERSKASRASQGPEKDIAKAVAMLVANGFTEAAAKQLILAQRETANLPV